MATSASALGEQLGADRLSVLRRLGEGLFPSDGSVAPSLDDSGAYEYLARRLGSDAALLESYRRGLDAAGRDLGVDPSEDQVLAWLSTKLERDEDLPTGLSGSLSPEAVEASVENVALFGIVLWQHLREGLFCDPRHGGNTDGVMWRWLGYNGPQLHGYTESELLENALPVRPMRFADDWKGER